MNMTRTATFHSRMTEKAINPGIQHVKRREKKADDHMSNGHVKNSIEHRKKNKDRKASWTQDSSHHLDKTSKEHLGNWRHLRWWSEKMVLMSMILKNPTWHQHHDGNEKILHVRPPRFQTVLWLQKVRLISFFLSWTLSPPPISIHCHGRTPRQTSMNNSKNSTNNNRFGNRNSTNSSTSNNTETRI